MIISFWNASTEAIFNGESTKGARKPLPVELWKVARRKLDQINHVSRLDQLSVPPGNRLEALKGDRSGQHSIRINDQYRVCFRWKEAGAEDVEITDYH